MFKVPKIYFKKVLKDTNSPAKRKTMFKNKMPKFY